MMHFKCLKLWRISSTILSPSQNRGMPDNTVRVIEIGW